MHLIKAADDNQHLAMGATMLRLEFQDVANTMIIRMEGQFIGRFAEDAGKLVARCRIPSRVVNLSAITSLDVTGEAVLYRLNQVGVSFVADTAYTMDVCERLKLTLSRQRGRALGQTV